MTPDIQLSANFTLSELTASQTASRYSISNTPNEEQIENLRALCTHVLQPLRDMVKTPIVISSGYRSVEVNKKVGGVPSSEHCLGRAADIVVPGLPNKYIAKFIVNNGFKFNQLILEFYDENRPYSGWVHVSYSTLGNKNEIYTFDGHSYIKGLS